MPLYEYECDAHQHRFELIRKFSDPPLTACPTCGSPVHKLFSSPAIQFKGSGFYITDYAKKDSTPAGKTDSGKDGDGKDSGAKESGAKDKTSGSSDKSSGSSEKSDSTPAAPAASTDTAAKSAAKSPAKSSTD